MVSHPKVKNSLIYRFKVLTIAFGCGIIILKNDGKVFDRLYIINV